MIRTPHTAPDLTATTTEAHVRAVAKECGLPVVPAGGFLFCVRRVPVLGQPIIYVARCEVRHG
jgi:hypothetical protein